MPNPEENQPTEITGSPLPTQTATVVSNHEGEDGMGSRSMTMGRYEETRPRLAEGRGLREIARERFETVEKAALKPLPSGDFECADWKDATLHPDCYVCIEGDYYRTGEPRDRLIFATPIQCLPKDRPEWTRHGGDYYDPWMATPVPVSSSAWRCRICAFERYHRVSVMRKNGSRYETQFFACSQCSVMFLNPTQFNEFSTAAPNIEFPPIVTPLRRRR